MSRRSAILLAGAIIGVLVVIGSITTVIVTNSDGSPDDACATNRSSSPQLRTAIDTSECVPGTFVVDQGRGHFSGGFVGHLSTPFCDGVPHAALTSAMIVIVAVGAPPIVAATPVLVGTPPDNPCYASNPPTSGRHLNVQRAVDVGGGNLLNIPPDPDVYPDEVDIPRDAIPHILEHAGVFVGWNCAADDGQCADAVKKLKVAVNDRIDNHSDRVVMAHDNDLIAGTIGVASWTRVLDIAAADYASRSTEITTFIARNSCRFDPEGFCR